MSTDTPRVDHTWVVYTIIGLALAMFGYELYAGVHLTDPTPQQLFDVGASTAGATLGEQQYYRIPLSMFLHFGLMHLGLNLICLWQARVVELVYGRTSFAVIYLLSGLAGGLATLIASDPRTVTAGASGAVFGVYGAFAAFLLVRKDSIPKDAWKQTSTGIGFFLVLNLIFGLVVPAISMSAHVGGLVFGFVAGAVLLAGTKPRTAPSARRIGFVFTAGAFVIVLVLRLIPRPDPAAAPTQLPDELVVFDRVAVPALARFADLQKRHAAQELDDGHAADELDHQIMGPWKLPCETLAKAAEARQDGLLASGALFCTARLAAWEALRDTWRAPPGSPARDDLDRAYRFAERDANELEARFVTAIHEAMP